MWGRDYPRVFMSNWTPLDPLEGSGGCIASPTCFRDLVAPQTKHPRRILTVEGGHHSPASTPKNLQSSVAGIRVQLSESTISRAIHETALCIGGAQKEAIVLQDPHSHTYGWKHVWKQLKMWERVSMVIRDQNKTFLANPQSATCDINLTLPMSQETSFQS